MTEVSLFDIVRPLLWIAAFAFVVGFAGYVFIDGRSEAVYAQDRPAALQATAPATLPTGLRAA